MTVSLQSIREAATAISGAVLATACLQSRTLSDITGAQVYLKFENHQFTASFKERGALNKLLALDAPQRNAGVIAVSAGNHAQGVAYHAKRLGVPAVIVMPRFTPHVKVEHTRAFGAEVILHGENFDEAKAHALQVMAQRRLTLLHPYDDEKIIAGQGTIALEMLEAHPDLEILVVPVGGGGLISGMAIAAKAINPAIRVIGVETVRFPSMLAALNGSEPTFGSNTIADGIAVKEPGRLTLEIIRREVEGIVLVDESDIEQAMLLLLEIEKTVVEGAGAVGLAALLRDRARFANAKVGVVLSGGNIDPLMMTDIVGRGMVRGGRLTRLQVELRDQPGALAKVSAMLAEVNANIVEVHHERAFTHLPVQSAVVDFVLQTRGHDHVKQIVSVLDVAGFKPRLRND
ncbi:MAG: threonine ammonia-lyase [Betaproteobacteria bacterium]